jgi:hypothetical protein
MIENALNNEGGPIPNKGKGNRKSMPKRSKTTRNDSEVE